MDEIARLLDDLAAGHLTAAVPLLDIFREEGMWRERKMLEAMIQTRIRHIDELRRQRAPEVLIRNTTLRMLGADVRTCFWHMLADRDEMLRATEEMLLSPGGPVGHEAAQPESGSYPPGREITITEADGPPAYNPPEAP